MIKMITWNINGLNSDKFTQFAQLYLNKRDNYDIIALEETWCTGDCDYTEFTIEGYKTLHSDAQASSKYGRASGGILVPVKDKLITGLQMREVIKGKL